MVIDNCTAKSNLSGLYEARLTQSECSNVHHPTRMIVLPRRIVSIRHISRQYRHRQHRAVYYLLLIPLSLGMPGLPVCAQSSRCYLPFGSRWMTQCVRPVVMSTRCGPYTKLASKFLCDKALLLQNSQDLGPDNPSDVVQHEKWSCRGSSDCRWRIQDSSMRYLIVTAKVKSVFEDGDGEEKATSAIHLWSNRNKTYYPLLEGPIWSCDSSALFPKVIFSYLSFPQIINGISYK